MKEIPVNYHYYSRQQWQQLASSDVAVQLSQAELATLVSTNDSLSLADIKEVYYPLLHYLELYMANYQHLHFDRSLFLQQKNKPAPFIIGIAGSVAVGKSTLARVLQTLLSQYFVHKKVQLVTTDGFLYSTKELEKKGLLQRKGFPESYNMKHLLQFLDEVKSGKKMVKAPVYSHQRYDVVPGEYIAVCEPDILIIEGINVLQNPYNEEIYLSDFCDFSVYLDAEIDNIKEWYISRYLLLRRKEQSDEEAKKEAAYLWKSINEQNLRQYILPTKYRADVILHKGQNHQMDYVLLRKY